MESGKIAKVFIEAMLRLRRDTINFQNLNVNMQLIFALKNTIIIYDIEHKVWNIKSEWIRNPKWNPTNNWFWFNNNSIYSLNHFLYFSI